MLCSTLHSRMLQPHPVSEARQCSIWRPSEMAASRVMAVAFRCLALSYLLISQFANGGHSKTIKKGRKVRRVCPIFLSIIGLGCLFAILVAIVLAWVAILWLRRKRVKDELSKAASTESMRMLDKKTRAVRRKIKEEKQTEAAFLRKQTWLQLLQILEHNQKSKIPDPTVFKLLKDRVNTLNYIELKKETARLIAMRPQRRRSDQLSIRSMRDMNDGPEIIDYIRSIADEALEEIELQKEYGTFVHKVIGCRLEKIQIRRDTQVFLGNERDPIKLSGSGKQFVQPRTRRPQHLHMNRMKDYYGNCLLLCQAPIERQFGDQWQAIWEQNVGVVVWIGAFVELGRPKIDPYIPLREGHEKRYGGGEYRVQTLFVAKFKDEFDVYRVGATFELAKCNKYRELIFIHIHMWPDHRIPDEPAQLADLVAQVQGHQLKQVIQGSPTMMCHCSLGVQRSPAFLAVYIGRQMWIANRRANVLGIMRYIRRNRWRAFGYGDPFAQVQIIFGVIQVIAMRHEMEGIANLNVALEEQRVFDHAARTADTEQQEPSMEKSKILG